MDRIKRPMAIGLIVFGLLLPGTLFVGQMGLDIGTLLSASFLIVVGVNSILNLQRGK
jgi:hypothetical protein